MRRTRAGRFDTRWCAVGLLVAGCAGKPAATRAPASTEHTVPHGGPSENAHRSGEHAHHGHSELPHHHGDGAGDHHGHDAVSGVAPATDDQPPTADHRFDDAERWSKIFDDPKRDAWQRPAKVVEHLKLAASDVVVDLGAGTGYFLPHLSRAVPKGRVIAVDVEPELLKFVDRRVKEAGLTNVGTRLAALDDPKLTETVDLVLLVDAYHHIGGRTKYFKKLRPRLSPRGRVVVVDFKLGKFPIGPPDSHKLAPEIVEREMIAAGYARCERWDDLPYQYVLTFAARCP